MTDTTVDQINDMIEGLLPWGSSYRVQTKRGARMLRKAKVAPTPEFWESWRVHKVSMKAAGISVSRNQDNTEWEVCWWQPLDEATLARERAAIEASRATDAAIVIPRGEGARALGHDYLPYQKAGIAYAMERRGCLIADEMGLGKLQPVTEPVLTPTGWRPIGDIAVGDRVIGADGKPTEVLGVFPQGSLGIVRVTFQDGSWTRCGLDHLWNVQTGNDVKRRVDRWRTMTTRDIMAAGLKAPSGNRKWRIPMTKPVVFDRHGPPLLVDPYTLGVALGDGSFQSNGRVAVTTTLEILHAIGARLITPHPSSEGIATGVVNFHGLAMDRHRSWEKHIPEEYLHAADPADRLALLQGLLDTDGSPMPDGGIEFCSTAEALVDGVTELVQSIGGIARNKSRRVTSFTYKGEKKKGRQSWRVNIKMPAGVEPFRYSEKAGRYKPPTKYPAVRVIDSIEPDGCEESVCIRVANEDGLYLTRGYIVTHNTIQAIGAANILAEKLGRRVLALVICPASLRPNWQREWQKWSIRRDDIPWIVQGGDAGAWPVHVASEGASPNLVIVNYDVTGKHATAMRRTRWDILICDEAHAMKSPDAQRTIAILGGGDKRNKATYVHPVQATVKLFLTGTPIVNRPKELWTLANALCPKVFHSRWKYEKRYCAATMGEYGMKTDGASNLAELQEICRREFMVRRLKKDVLAELPAKRRQVLEVVGRGLEAVVAAEREAYAQREERILAAKAKVELAKAEDDKKAYKEAVESLRSEVSMTIGEMAEMRQLVALAKVPVVVDHVLSLADSCGKVVVFAHHKKVVDALMDGLAELNPVKITGDVKMQDRDDAVKAFQTDPNCRCFIGNIAAAGVGITLTASSTVVFAELDWTPAGMSQCEDRTHRLGQLESVLVQHVVIDGSLDAHMAKMLVQKQAILDLALDQETQPDEPEPDEPVTTAPPAATEGVARSHFHTAGAMLTRAEIEAAHRAVRMLAQACDFARAEDGSGFNATDARMGHELASRESLSPAAAALAARIAVRYAKTQLDEGTAALVRSAAAKVEQAKDAARRSTH